MKVLTITTTLVLVGFISACSGNSKELHPHDWALDVQNAETRQAHLLLADHYEEIAKIMDADADEERRMLIQYEAKPWKYGRQIQDIKSRAQGMINHFEKAADDSRKMAEYHRKFAEESR